jgi:integrase/recombinase XerD
MSSNANFAPLLQRFFTERLMQQRHASPHTISSYRDTFRLLLQFAQTRLKKSPSRLALEDVDAPLISDFLNDLVQRRGISAQSRNVRLVAIRSLFHYAAFEMPAQSEQIQRILAIPCQRYNQELVNFLTRPEVDALLAVPDQLTWGGRRDHACLLLAVQTGLRLSELTGLTRSDVHLDTGAHVHVIGKGRKERCVPLAPPTVKVLKAWLQETPRDNGEFVFPNARGTRLSSDGLQYLLSKHVTVARQTCPSLRDKRVSPHVLRHANAMDLLQSGTPPPIIALWLGHESIETTHIYLQADLAMKEKILAKTTPHEGHPGVYKPDDPLLAFLKSL